MTFGDEVKRAVQKIEQRTRDVEAGVVLEVERSIRIGSEITGAPGQPVDTQELLNSWLSTRESEHVWLVATNREYAPPVEDGVGRYGPVAYGLKNGIGGSHSVALTRANFDKVVEVVTKRVVGAQG